MFNARDPRQEAGEEFCSANRRHCFSSGGGALFNFLPLCVCAGVHLFIYGMLRSLIPVLESSLSRKGGSSRRTFSFILTCLVLAILWSSVFCFCFVVFFPFVPFRHSFLFPSRAIKENQGFQDHLAKLAWRGFLDRWAPEDCLVPLVPQAQAWVLDSWVPAWN